MTGTVSEFIFRLLRIVITPLACVLLFAHIAFSASEPEACSTPKVAFDDSSDIQSVAYFTAAIQQLFVQEKFAELDCLANAARSSKSRFASGGWRLNVFYLAIAEPQGHATEEDWGAHLETLNRWVSKKPESITARVALADGYTSYAWNARGSGYSDTVTQSGWKLFSQRIDKAKKILEDASRLQTKCPHWFDVMQTVALAESWDLTRATQLLDQAVAFEPDYQYYYRNYANYLGPHWNGEEGDAEKFAEQAADRVGGVKGDVLYFQIATQLICHCSAEPNLKLLSWPRIQKGVGELEKQNGASLINLNLLAYMAVKENDSIIAHNAFLRIGDNWHKDIWRTEQYFDSSRSWATQTAAYLEAPGQQVIQQAKNKFAPVIRQCVQAGNGDATKFTLLVRLQKSGLVDYVLALPQTKVGLCLMKLTGETVSPPPYAPFTFQIDVDPTQLISATAH
jgi:hypothetical protein